MTEYSFLVLIKKSHSLCFENSSCKLLSFNDSENSFWSYNGRCVASWNSNCVWFAGPTFPESNSKVLLKLCMTLSTLV